MTIEQFNTSYPLILSLLKNGGTKAVTVSFSLNGIHLNYGRKNSHKARFITYNRVAEIEYRLSQFQK